MGLVLVYTKRVRNALKSPASIGVDLLLLVGLAGFIAAIAMVLRSPSANPREPVVIDLSLWACRGTPCTA